MDGGGQHSQEGQRQIMEQHQGGWYGAPQNPYQQHHQPQVFKWTGYDPPIHYAQPPMQAYSQPDYYMQQQQQQYAAPPPQQPQVQQTQQHLHVYAQQEQVWPPNNGWNQPQWTQQGSSTGSEEEDWAAKARAWAAAKAAQELVQQAAQQAHIQAQAQSQAQAQAEAQAQAQAQAQAHAQAQAQTQTIVLQQEQNYHDYQQDASEALRYHSETAQLSSLLPPGQDLATGFMRDASSNFGQDGHNYAPESRQAFIQDDIPPSFDRPPSAFPQAAHAQVVPSSYSQDLSSSYGQDTAIAGPPGADHQEPSGQKLSPHTSVALALPQPHQSQVPTQVSPHTQSHQFSFQEPVPPAAFEFHQHQQFDFQPPPQDYQQQPPGQYLPPATAMGMDSAEIGFGGPPNAISVWPSIGGLPFPPNMGPGGPGGHPGPQFDHPHHNQHLHHSHPMHGHPPPHMFPRSHGPPHGPSFRPPGPPLGGPFGFGGSPSLGQGPGGVGVPIFLPDGNGNLGAPERPKKASVPSWLREELLKKKASVGAAGSAVVSVSDDFVGVNGNEPTTAGAHKLGLSERTRSDSSGMSDNDDDDDDDDEDESEAARTAAMNQEIKRVLTEVLLRVTDDLFGEIAQEVLDEDEFMGGQGQKSISGEASGRADILPFPAAPPVVVPARVLVAPVRRNRAPSEEDSDSSSSGAPVGNVLGLATYASDDEDAERGQSANFASTDPEITEGKKRRDPTDDTMIDQGSVKIAKDDSGDLKDSHQEDGKNLMPIEKEKKERKVQESAPEKDRDMGGEEKGDRDGRSKDREGRGREKAFEKEEKKDQRSGSKGKKRSSDDSSSSDQDTRSPRRARHVEAENEITDSDHTFQEKVDSDPPGRQSKTVLLRHHATDLKEEKQSGRMVHKKVLDALSELSEQGERASSTGHTMSTAREHAKVESKVERHAKENRVHSTDGSTVALPSVTKGRVESTDITVRKTRDNEDGNKDRDRSKHRSRDGEKEHEDKGDKAREKEKPRDKEWEKENERGHEKERTRDSERTVDRDRVKGERGRERVRGHERERKKVDKERIDRGRERRKDFRDARKNRRRSSSSSRGRSRSRSPSSGSHGSSSGGDKSKSPKQRRQPLRSSRRRSISRSPVRSRRRRLSRSRSRSPPSKYSHRRHSPSPSRETERHR